MTWCINDIALCIRDDWDSFPAGWIAPRRRGYYTVMDVSMNEPPARSYLAFRETQSAAEFDASSFVKVPPLTDEERREFLIDLEFDIDVLLLQAKFNHAPRGDSLEDR
jgi:hypothetical protein